MKRNISTTVILIFSLMVMFLWLTGSGCKGKVATPPTSSTQPPPPPTVGKINVSSLQISAGDVVINSMTRQAVSVRNTGTGSLTIGQIAQANPLDPPFSIVLDGCSGQALEPSASCSFQVQFSPTSQGTFTDSFDIPSNASNENSVTMNVSGIGKALAVVINQVNTASCSTGVLELVVNVTDQNNNPLLGLGPSNFQLKENGVLQPLESVSEMTSTIPVSMAMVLDYSGTMASQIPTLQAASINFIGGFSPDDEAAVVKFGELYQLMQDFTSNKTDLITAINTVPSQIGSGATYLYDSLYYAIGITAVRQKHKVIVLITDGQDENSLGQRPVSIHTPDQVIAFANQNGVEIYAIGMGAADSSVLNQFATGTGGQYYYMTNADQLASVYQVISNILSGKYSIKYVTTLNGSSPITWNIDVAVGADQGTAVGVFAGCP